MIKSKLLIVVSLLGLLNGAIAQQPVLQKYVIITFEDTYQVSPHGIKNYYWIIPQDSIRSNNNTLSHLFLKNFSKNNFSDCCSGKEIDPFLIVQETNYDFGASYSKSLQELEQLVSKRRRKLQTITKIWQSGQKESVTIFATPVSGKFCSSNFHLLGQQRLGYKGKVYIPFSSFTYLEEFWKSSLAKFMLAEDFSTTKFDIIPY